MRRKGKFLAMFAVFIPGVCSTEAFADQKEINPQPAVLWRDSNDIASRNLLYGPGGAEDQPCPPYTFVKEDLSGSNPKFDVLDHNGITWKVKLGEEPKPETVATRLLWAIGYFTDEDYFLANFRAQNMPEHLQRKPNAKFIEPDGSFSGVRLKRSREGEKKIGIWDWRQNPFTGTRELNGLRVMMAVINNWDLKNENNAIYRDKRSGDQSGTKLVYEVSDLGASFGTTSLLLDHAKAKGNLDSYVHSKFIRKQHGDLVDFEDPHRPTFGVFFNPHEFVSRVNMEWIGRDIPKADAKWVGQLLATLSPEQIRDAFRAAQYEPEDVEAFASALELRITELNQLWVASSEK